MMSKYAVIGGGSWATAITKMLSNNCDQVVWWMRDSEQVNHIIEHHHNPRYLRAVEFDLDIVRPTQSLSEAIDGCNIIIIATPSPFIDEVLRNQNLNGKKIISAIKGIIPQTNEIPAEYFQSKFGVDLDNFGVICGPCHAEEVAMERLSYLTIGASNEELSQVLANDLSSRYIKCTTTADIIGVELAAILKNVYAIASGICHGLGYGDNFMAVLMSNAICEIERFVNKVYPVERDVKLSAYLGDLLVTAYSLHSRNRRFGNMIGKGYSVKSVQQEMNMVAEGYYASACINKMNEKHHVDIPIAKMVYRILYEGKKPENELKCIINEFI